jgi:ATP-dependent DNA ligase
MTIQYPDVVEFVEKTASESGVDNFILDSELVAYDHEAKRILPFQTLT